MFFKGTQLYNASLLIWLQPFPVNEVIYSSIFTCYDFIIFQNKNEPLS